MMLAKPSERSLRNDCRRLERLRSRTSETYSLQKTRLPSRRKRINDSGRILENEQDSLRKSFGNGNTFTLTGFGISSKQPLRTIQLTRLLSSMQWVTRATDTAMTSQAVKMKSGARRSRQNSLRCQRFSISKPESPRSVLRAEKKNSEPRLQRTLTRL